MTQAISACGKKETEVKKKNNKQEQSTEGVLCLNPQRGVKVANIDFPKLKENSGIDFSNKHEGIFWSLNDSSGLAVFALGIDGTNYGKFELPGVKKVDWEDIALAKCFHNSEKDCLYIGDIGNNERLRQDFKIYVIEEPADFRAGGRLELVNTLSFKVDGSHNFEAFVVNERTKEFYFISKNDDLNLARGVSSVFALAQDQSQATLIATLDFNEMKIPLTLEDKIVTGADFDQESQTLLLGTNGNAFEVSLSDLGKFKKRARIISIPKMQQTEAIAYYWKDGKVNIVATSEGKMQPLYLMSCDN